MTSDQWEKAKTDRPIVTEAARRLVAAWRALDIAFRKHVCRSCPATVLLDGLEGIQSDGNALADFAATYEAFRQAQLDAVAKAESEQIGSQNGVAAQ